MPMDTQVLIAGAGPTGLTLAIELARRGIDLRIVDKAERFAVGSRGDGLQPRKLEVFQDLGVLEEVFAAGISAPVMRIYDGESVVWEDQMAKPEPPRADVPYPNLWIVPQWRTEEILRSRLSSHGVEVQLGSEVVAVDQDIEQEGAGVTVRLQSGETVRARYLVGADGGHSTVRRQLAIPFLGTTDNEVQMVEADVRIEGLDHDYGHGWMLDGREVFAFTPLAGAADTFVVNTTVSGLEPTLPALQATVDAAVRANRHPAARVDLGHHLALECSPGAALPRRAGVPGGRCCSRAPAGRRTGTQHRCAGRLQPRLETRHCGFRARRRTLGFCSAARQLPGRASADRFARARDQHRAAGQDHAW